MRASCIIALDVPDNRRHAHFDIETSPPPQLPDGRYIEARKSALDDSRLPADHRHLRLKPPIPSHLLESRPLNPHLHWLLARHHCAYPHTTLPFP